MKIYKCIIIDDEPKAIEWLTEYIEQLPNLELQRSFTDPLAALAQITGGDPVDIVFMDIDMPYISGIDLSAKIRSKISKLIFTTAYRDFAYDAFEADADAFLLKPYTLSKFAATVTKLFPETNNHTIPPENDYFLAKNSNDDLKIVKIYFADVVAIESKQNYVMIHTLKNNILTHMSLREVSYFLKNHSGFVQYQRSFIIAKKHIDHIYGNTIKMITGLEITVGDLYRKDFVNFINDKLIKSRAL